MKHKPTDGGKGSGDRTKDRKQYENNFSNIKFGTIKKDKDKKKS